MNKHPNRDWFWLALIAGGFAALALGATFAPQILNQPIANGPATWGLVASALYLVFVMVVMGLATRPFGSSEQEADQ